MDATLLTVLVPTFNRVDLLKICLESLESQTVKGFNVLVLDNHSDDGTLEYLQNYQSRSFKIEVLHRKQNIGYFKNILDGISRVSSKYMTFLSDDNVYRTNCLEALLGAMTIDNSVSLVVGSHNLTTFEGAPISLRSKLNNFRYGRSFLTPKNLDNIQIRRLQLKKKIISIDSSCFLVSQLKEAAVTEDHGLDYSLFSQYVILGGAAVLIHKPLMDYRENRTGVSQSRQSRSNFAQYCLSACRSIINKNNLSAREIRYIEKYIFHAKYILHRNGEFTLRELIFQRPNILRNFNLIIAIKLFIFNFVYR